MIEFPEVFYAGGRIRLTDQGLKRRRRTLDAVVGNPPFLGGKLHFSECLEADYRDWLCSMTSGTHGNCDLCAHFFRRAAVAW